MPTPGESVPLAVEKPAAGGRMIARLGGRVVLVNGAIPGERVRARIERVGKGVIYADTTAIESPSADRRTVVADPLCGGCLYAHIAYPRQLEIKSQIVADAFARIGRLALPAAVPVAPSPEEGYRMRARLHVRGRRAGFFREGTHDVCDFRSTRQLLAGTCDALDRFIAELTSAGPAAAREIELSENVDASERVVSLDVWTGIDARARSRLAAIEGLTGVGPDASVADRIVVGSAPAVVLRRSVRSFFQGNRYLLNDLVAHVIGLVPEGADLLDLYAGSGLFSVTAAAVRGARVTAVEGDRAAAADLQVNASACVDVAIHHLAVEEFFETEPKASGAVVVDPPRTGLSRGALGGVLGLRPSRVIYVSCDPATLARDARRFVDGGYAIEQAACFDLFPGTPHIETVAVFTPS